MPRSARNALNSVCDLRVFVIEFQGGWGFRPRAPMQVVFLFNEGDVYECSNR